MALSDRSVSRIEIELIASSSVFGIFWASAMWSNVVARLENVMGCQSRIRFLVSRKACDSAGV